MVKEEVLDIVQQAISLMQSEKYEDVIAYTDKAISLDPRYAEAYVVKADAYVNLDKPEEALAVYNKALLIEPENGELYFNIGNIYVLLDDPIKCLKSYNKADELGYSYFGLYKNLADLYRSIDKPDMALVNYTKAIAASPLDEGLRLEKAGYQIMCGYFEEALETLEDLQALQPDLYEAITMRAVIYTGLKNYKKALEIIDDAIAQLPEDPALRVERVRIFIASGKLDDAKAELDALKQMELYEYVKRPAKMFEAQIAALEQDLDKAGVILEEIVRDSDEVDEEVYSLLLNVLFAKERYPKALEIAQKLAAVDNESIYVMNGKFYLPQILQRMGRTDEAMAMYKELTSYFRKVTINDPHFYEVYLYRILCHKELGEYEKALELADYVVTLDPDSSDGYAMKYAIYKAMKDGEKAEEMKKIVNRINPALQL